MSLIKKNCNSLHYFLISSQILNMNQNTTLSLLFIAAISTLISCSTNKEIESNTEMIESNLLKEKDVTEKIIVYQLFVRLFGNKVKTNKFYGTIEENGTGKFSDISNTALIELKKFGVTHIWFTGVLEHAVMNDYSKYGIHVDNANIVKGRAGSPYSIKDYFDVNPDLADNVERRMDEFEELIKRTHENGMKVIIDFIPNHVARY